MTALRPQQRTTLSGQLCVATVAAVNLHQLSTQQRQGSHHLLNVHNIYG